MLTGAARGLALFLGGFTLLNFAGPDANLWWIDFWPLPLIVRWALLAALAVALIAYAVKPRPSRITTMLLVLTLAFALVNAVRYYVVLSRGDIRSELPLPLSLLIAISLTIILVAQRKPPRTSRAAFGITFLLAAGLFPLAQISLYGITDYRRRADVIVVFGARAYASGHPSPTLADRVRTGIELYEERRAPRLVFSGGPGDGAVDEPEAMRRYAVRRGVPDSAIVLDPLGLNTEATVRNTVALADGRRILAVSDFYHLPRIKMTFQRYGVDVYTVPARTSVPQQMPYNIARESAAFWAYYLRRFH